MNNNLKKNYILFLVLSTLVIFSYSYFFYKPEKKPEISSENKTAAEQLTLDTGSTENEEVKNEITESNIEKIPAGYSSKIITVNSDEYIAKIDTLGGRLIDLQLKEYTQTTDKNSPLVKVVDDSKKSFYSILKLKNIDVPLQIPYNYGGDSEVTVDSESFNLNLIWNDGSGITVKKTITFFKSSYFIEEYFDIENNTESQLDEK
ncbi:MAG: membrane protein insertase YidC, partial [Thermodesulfobacteriota bacterium]